MTTARAKGTALESAIRDHARSKGRDIERLRTAGKNDEGDLVLRMTNSHVVIIEAKSVAAMNLGGWLNEAQVEAKNYQAARPNVHTAWPVVVHKRRQKGVGGAYVTMDLDTFLDILESW